MAFEQNDMSGALFPNRDRKTDRHPNATGSALINGIEFWVSAWTKIDRNGNKFQSLSFKIKEQREPDGGRGHAQRDDGWVWRAPGDPLDDEIPFIMRGGIW